MNQGNPTRRLYIVYLVAFIDMLGFGIIIPVVRDYTSLLAQNSNLGQNHAFLAGILMASYSFFQFLFAPFLGRLSDRFGRKPILFLSVAGNVLSYLLWAISNDYWLFLISRIISGATGANISVAQSYVADVTDEKSRGKYMGMMGALFGLGFILGPAIGGYLSQFHIGVGLDLGLIKFNQFSLIGIATAGLSLVNLLLIVFFMIEPNEKKAAVRGFKQLASFTYLIKKLTEPSTGRLFLIYFFFSYAFVHLEATLAWDLKNRFFMDAKATGYFFAFMGLLMAVVQGGIYRRIYTRMSELTLANYGMIFTASGLLLLAIFSQSWMLYVTFAIIALGMGLASPSFSTLVSLYAPKEEQGLYLGIMQSYASLARTIAPLTATLLYDYVQQMLPYYGAAAIIILAIFLVKGLPKTAPVHNKS